MEPNSLVYIHNKQRGYHLYAHFLSGNGIVNKLNLHLAKKLAKQAQQLPTKPKTS